MIKVILAIILLLISLTLIIKFLITIFKPIFIKNRNAPYVWSFKRHLELMEKLSIKDNWSLLDLWCGDGKALRFFDKNFNLRKLVWYDINKYAIFLGKILNKILWHKKIDIKLKDFTKWEIKWYDYIYFYLRPSQLARIEKRVREKKDKNTIIISNSFEFSKHKPYEIIKNRKWKKSIFLYK